MERWQLVGIDLRIGGEWIGDGGGGRGDGEEVGNFVAEYPGQRVGPRGCCWRKNGWDSKADCLGIERRGAWGEEGEGARKEGRR